MDQDEDTAAPHGVIRLRAHTAVAAPSAGGAALHRDLCDTGQRRPILHERADVAGEGVGFRGTREERKVLDLAGEFAPAKERALERIESVYLAALMKRCAGNLSRAAREANVARHHLRDLLKKRGLYGVSWDAKEDEG